MRRILIAWLPLALWAAGVLAIGAFDFDAPSLPTGSDKAAHFVMYGVGGVLAAWVARRTRASAGWQALGFVALVAAVDELHQTRVASRSSDVWDWVADIAGALVAHAVARWLLSRQGRA